jgi:peroxiredoxin family protein
MAKKTNPYQENQRHLKQYNLMRTKLLNWVDPKICRLDLYYNTAIFFIFKGFQVIVIPKSNAYKYAATSKSAKVVYDEDFQMINTIMKGKRLKKDYDNASSIIESLLQAVKQNLSQTEALAAMEQAHDYIIKKNLQEYYKLTENPDREYFLYGDDQLEPRYRGYQPPISLPEGVAQRVRIKDSSALLITQKDGRKYIDLNSGIHYSDDKFIYFGSLTERKKCTAKSDYHFVSYNSKTNEKTYYKTVLKKGVNLANHEDKVPYVRADKMELDLYFDASKQEFYFQDEVGDKITISHPDLMVYLL